MRNIKHVVIIDDSPFKVKDIVRAVSSMYPEAECHIFSTANEGLKFLSVDRLSDVKEDPVSWLLLTDMQMPIMQGTGINKTAGRHVLDQMHKHLLLHEGVRVTTLVISGDKQDGSYLGQLYDGCLGCVQYSPFVDLGSQMRVILEPDD